MFEALELRGRLYPGVSLHVAFKTICHLSEVEIGAVTIHVAEGCASITSVENHTTQGNGSKVFTKSVVTP